MIKNATFRQLAALHAVARLGSVSSAATELHLTQPAISIQIKLLEDAAGMPLLEREGRGIRLSGAGEVLSGYAARILDLWREAGDEMAAQRGGFSGTLRVGAVTTAEYLLPPLLVAFADGRPEVKIQLKVGNRGDIVHMLAGQEIDVAIMGRPPAELKTKAVSFARHPMAFLAAPGDPLMARRRLSIADLAQAKLLVRERGSGTRATLEALYKAASLPLRVGSELSSNEAIKQMCAAGFGVAFLSLHTCRLELDAGMLALLPMKAHPIESDWYAVHLATRRMPQMASAFMQFLSDQGQRLILRQLEAGAATASATPAAGKTRARSRRPS
jgi:DNA-binding transcriptional LysR family regulator